MKLSTKYSPVYNLPYCSRNNEMKLFTLDLKTYFKRKNSYLDALVSKIVRGPLRGKMNHDSC